MTYTEDKITSFIEARIEDMHHTIEYANELEETREEKISYARWSIQRTSDEGFGALLFAKCYLHEIDQLTYDELNNRLMDEYMGLDRNLRSLIG